MAIAALFGGQGSQYPGMGKELYTSFGKVREIYTAASDILGFDVAKTSFEGTPEELARTAVAQPATFTHAMAALAALREQTELPIAAVAGHSLGEFAALCCAGAYTLEDGLRIIKARAAAMEKMSGGVMYAIVGSEQESVFAACAQAGGFVQPVNFNLPNQTVISGEAEPCARAAALLAEKGAKTIQLAVGSAFHTAMMEPAAAELREAVKAIPFAPAVCNFYSNLTGGKLIIQDYPAYFARHMVSPVRFVQEMQAMAEDGIAVCVEFGPKKTASTLAKKNVRTLTVCNVEDLASLEKTVQQLKN